MKQEFIQTKNGSSQPGAFVIAKAVLIGFLVSGIGVSAWSLLFTRVAAPWSAIAMVAVLYVYWKFFSGKWGRAGAETRKNRFRSEKLPVGVWVWGLVAAACFVAVVQSSFVITFRIFEFPAKRFTADYKILDHIPLWSAWLAIVMGSVVAGISEETGFRGYMQAPIEKKYGPVTAIVITSAIFMLVHLSHSWAAPIIPHIFFASVLLGILAFKTGSLIPGNDRAFHPGYFRLLGLVVRHYRRISKTNHFQNRGRPAFYRLDIDFCIGVVWLL